MRSQFMLLSNLTLLVAVCAVAIIMVLRYEPVPTPEVDDTEYELLVCVNGNGGPLYSGLVDMWSFGTTHVHFSEPTTGLRRKIQNAACVLTTGTKAQFQAAQTEGGTVNEPDPTDSESGKVDEPQP